jgi:hypothetical protein
MLGAICIFSINGWGHCSVLQIMGIELDPIDKGGSDNLYFCLDFFLKKIAKTTSF